MPKEEKPIAAAMSSGGEGEREGTGWDSRTLAVIVIEGRRLEGERRMAVRDKEKQSGWIPSYSPCPVLLGRMVGRLDGDKGSWNIFTVVFLTLQID